MKSASEELIDLLKQNGCSGELEKIQLADDLDEKNLTINSCEFYGENTFLGRVKFSKSVFNNSVFYGHNHICCSTVLSSKIGAYTIIKNNSVVKKCSTSGITIDNHIYPVLINDSQLVGDVILGGTDFNQTKSRGKSLFLFSHIGSGEFVRSTIIGTQPNAETANSLVEVGHFGYYGDLNVLSLAIKNNKGEYVLPKDKNFFDLLDKALEKVFLSNDENKDFTVEKGRSNFGAGTTVSNYDPIKGTKAGALFILASCGANVSISPYLTVLPGSLIATGSVDLTREQNVIGPNSLAIGARDKTVLFEGYLDTNQRKIMNDRTYFEVDYLRQNLRLVGSLASFFAKMAGVKEGSERMIFMDAFNLQKDNAQKLASKTIPKYFELLSQSIEALERKAKQLPGNTQKYNEKIKVQRETLETKEDALNQSNEILNKIGALAQDGLSSETSSENDLDIVLTKGQEDQLSDSLINIKNL